MEKTDPSSVPSKNKVTLAYINTNIKLGIGILILLVVAGFAIDKLATRQQSLPALESPQWLQEHCPIAVSVNVFVPQGTTDDQSGVSVQGKISSPSAKKPSVEYTWQVSKDDQFCGIMGVSGSLKGAQYKSLRPAKGSTPQKGSYTDYSLGTSKNGFHMNEFWVFAKPAPH